MVIKKPDWREQANKWRAGEIVWSAELGGMGPGYEQAIQTLLFEIIARWPKDTFPKTKRGNPLPKVYQDHVDSVVKAINSTCGFSGAQVDQARGTAFQFMRYGYNHMMGKLEQDRKIMVSNHWPRVPDLT